MWLWYVLCPRAVKFITHAPLYLFPFSFLNEPPYLLRLPSISVISGIKLANIAYNTTTNVVRHQHGQTDHTHTHTYTTRLPLAVFLLVRAAVLAASAENVHDLRYEASKHRLKTERNSKTSLQWSRRTQQQPA